MPRRPEDTPAEWVVDSDLRMQPRRFEEPVVTVKAVIRPSRPTVVTLTTTCSEQHTGDALSQLIELAKNLSEW